MPEPQNGAAWNEVIHFVNRDFVDPSNFLQKLDAVEKTLQDDRNHLEKQLNLIETRNADRESYTEDVLQELTTDARTLISEIDAVCEGTSSHLTIYEREITDIKTTVTNIEDIDKCIKYLEFINHLEDESSFIQSSMLIENMDQSVRRFANLVNLLQKIKDTKCKHLKDYTESIVIYWYNMFLSKFSKRSCSEKAEQVFQCKTKHSISLPIQFFLQPFHKRFNFHFYGHKKTNSIEKPEWYFTQLSMWLNDQKDFVTSKLQHYFDAAGYQHIDVLSQFAEGLVCLASDKLHKDLNSLLNDKSLADNDQLFAHHVDEALNFNNEMQTLLSYSLSFSGILEVLVEKAIFCKWIAIEKSYALRKMDAMMEMTDAWLMMVNGEVDDCKVPHFAELFLVLLVTIHDRYQHLPDIDSQLEFSKLQLDLIDDFRIRLVHLRKQLTSVTSSSSATFFQHQQQHHVIENPKYAAILNTVTYFCDVFKRWTNEPLFIKLNFHKKKIEKRMDREKMGLVEKMISKQNETDIMNAANIDDNAEEDDDDDDDDGDGGVGDNDETIFDGMMELYEGMKRDMLATILNSIVDEFKNNSKPYMRDKFVCSLVVRVFYVFMCGMLTQHRLIYDLELLRWLALPSHKEFISLALSNSACHMFKTLKVQLDSMETLLNNSLFNVLWRDVADLLDKFIYENIICVNHFNEGGAMQLNFDMTRNLFPLFSSYTNKPENHFKCVKEACAVLILTTGSAMLIRDVLKRALHPCESKVEVSDPIAALQDVGVFKLEPEHVEYLLSLRIDLPH
ncbi:hypothetical protein HELRODRAFT_195046 [Helobdella robusta]|uniref:RAD50-interacting protein 1 n=1 Tax=Helobdella robusta TaxID=6412 RepID=T1FWP7_HELRO|nr:hypothetical protein HELRODRAFT_195046 [Helobdella robusta]ESO09658.1 hypothetical protein HELRODRAFT_195046 [Helobdella robusta]